MHLKACLYKIYILKSNRVNSLKQCPPLSIEKEELTHLVTSETTLLYEHITLLCIICNNTIDCTVVMLTWYSLHLMQLYSSMFKMIYECTRVVTK